MVKFRLRITGDLGFEVWQDIEGFEGYYKVSNYGRIKTVERIVYNGRGYKVLSEYIKQPSNNRGYLQIKLYKDNTNKIIQVHRLVAYTFIPNFYNYPCINHKDEVKNNNRVENLGWCTIAYNNNYNGRYDRVSRKMGRRVQQLKDGVVVGEYQSCSQAAKLYNIHRCHIAECARGIRKNYAGYEWKYV